MGIRIRLGLGAVPLRSMGIHQPSRLGMDSRLRVGTRMGRLAEWWRLLRLGPDGSRSRPNGFRWPAAYPVGLFTDASYIRPAYPPALEPRSPQHLQPDHDH